MTLSLNDFEWLIITGGSTDGTAEQVEAWQEVIPFPIRIYEQDEPGFHREHNLARDCAEGTYTVTLDSEYRPLPYTVERFGELWQTVDREVAAPIQADDVGHPGDGCREHGRPAGHRFEDDRRQPLRRMRQQHQQPQLAQVRGQLRVCDPTRGL